jgi:hypothetical protein
MNETLTLMERIPAFLLDHPGARTKEIIEAMGVSAKKVRWRLTQLFNDEAVFRAGRPHSLHYFADRASAIAAHPEIVRLQEAASRERQIAHQRQYEREGRHLIHRQPRNVNPAYVALDAEILRLSSMPQGFECRAMTCDGIAHDTRKVSDRVAKLRRHGGLYVGTRGHKTKRYFTDIRHAKAWEDSRPT